MKSSLSSRPNSGGTEHRSPVDTCAIRVENLGKQYKIGLAPERYRTLRDTIAQTFTAPFHKKVPSDSPRLGPSTALKNGLSPNTGGTEHRNGTEHHFWALKDISFDVNRGQVLGVIGRNGAGKSTLLKILARITEPTQGIAEVHGRVGSLLEVGTGFHPELTGRENIYLNGAILGMKRSEIDRKFAEIVDFSEVEKFIDTPVKRYSSGMYLRLAFAVAAHMEPEILVVDEVLAVGDAEFQRKCMGKMSDVAQTGRTVLFVSHNMSAIQRLTEETIVLEKGRLALRAPTPAAVDYYLSSGFSQVGERCWHADEIPPDTAPFIPIAVRVRDRQNRVVDTVRSTEPFNFEIEYRLDAPITGLRLGIYLQTTRGELLFTSFDTDDPELYDHFRTRTAGTYTSRCVIQADTLNEGRYVLGVNASTFRIRRYFQDEQALTFNVDATGAPGMQWPETRQGPLRPRLDWKVTQVEGDH
jgi:lipopolysaccharide transport system ATP-binding protein